MNRRLRLLVGIASVAALLLLACGGGDDTADQSLPTATPQTLSDVEQEPRFEGVLLGIFIGPQIPEHIIGREHVCLPGTPIKEVEPGELGLEVDLPPKYVRQDPLITFDVAACGLRVLRAQRTYLLEGAPEVSVTIGRRVFSYGMYDVAASRVETAVFAGREAVLIAPPVAGREGGASAVLFPEPFGVTEVQASSLPLADLLELAGLVAEATLRSDGELEPRFQGELLGIFIGPRVTDVPERFITFDDVCATPFSVEVPWARAGELDLELNLPPRYVLQDDSINTGVIACEDKTVYVARRNYRLEGSPSANIIIGRSILTADLFDVTASRVSVAIFAGREAILIEPGVRDGLQSERSGVILPEPLGLTFVHAVSLSLDDLLELAELVAEATQRP